MAKRRTKGDGGLYQRHDHPDCPELVTVGHDDDGKPILERPEHRCQGRWVGTIDVWVDGRKRRKYVYGRTQREARLKLDQARREKSDGTLVVASMTVEKWLDTWLDDIADLKPQTRRGYRSKIETYIKPALGRYRLTELRPEHIRHMHARMRGDGLAEASVRQAHAILKRALKIAVHEGKLGVSPADRMESPGTETAKREQLTVDQARQVLAAAGDDARWWLALYYGMRQGEVLGLRWCDVDFDRRALRVVQSLQADDDGALIFGPPKSRASRRVMPMLPLIESRLQLRWIASGLTDPATESLVFPGASGGPRQPKRDWQEWRALLDRAARPPFAPLPLVTLHSARNTAASVLEAAGVPARLVAQILGHAQVSTTHGYQDAELARITQALSDAAAVLALE